MSIVTEGTDEGAPETPSTSDQTREHVQAGELSNGGLDLAVGEAKDDGKEAVREAHHEYHPDTGNT